MTNLRPSHGTGIEPLQVGGRTTHTHTHQRIRKFSHFSIDVSVVLYHLLLLSVVN